MHTAWPELPVASASSVLHSSLVYVAPSRLTNDECYEQLRPTVPSLSSPVTGSESAFPSRSSGFLATTALSTLPPHFAHVGSTTTSATLICALTNSYKEALSTLIASEWLATIPKEHDCLLMNKTVDVVIEHLDMRILPSMYIFRQNLCGWTVGVVAVVST